MKSPLPEPETPFGAKVRSRLQHDVVAWLTVVTPGGTPQPNPVAFLWNGDDTVLVYSQAGAARLAHLNNNPKVALSFNNCHALRDVVVLTGVAEPSPSKQSATDNVRFMAKYATVLRENAMDPSWYAMTFTEPLIVRVLACRGT
jgi:PPOX class probable F420-dependent enzyme